MTMHTSLKVGSGLAGHRNVLTRAERLAKLIEEEKFQEGRSILGLPKVRSIKPKRKAKAKKEETAEGAAAPAAGAKAAAPAAGAKAGAPAAKAAAPAAKAAGKK